MRCAVLGLVVVAAILGIYAPASAHTIAPASPVVVPIALVEEVLTAAAAAPSPPWTALALLAGIVVATISRQRRAVAITLAVVVGVLAFETGVHSTHHLGKPGDSAHCAVASAVAQLSADLVGGSGDAAPVATAESIVLTVGDVGPTDHLFAPDAGRAPPLLSA